LSFDLNDFEYVEIELLNRPQNFLTNITELKLKNVGLHADLSDLRPFMAQLRMVQKVYVDVHDVDRYCVNVLRQILPYFDQLEELEVFSISQRACYQASEFFAVVRDCCLHLKTLIVPPEMLEDTRNHFGDTLVVE
jgi:hypothetical protein